LRIHDLSGQDIGGRIDTNLTAGITSGTDITDQFAKALAKFEATRR